MDKKFYIVSTTALSVILVLMLVIRVTPVLSLEGNSIDSNPKIVDSIEQFNYNSGPIVILSQSIAENTPDADGNVDLTFNVQNDELIRGCTLYHNINQPFGPDPKQINTFIQLDYPTTFNLENVSDGNYEWAVVCEDRLFRKNLPNKHHFIVKKSPPESTEIPNIGMKEDDLFVLNLSNYFSDSSSSFLTYEAVSSPQNINVKIDQLTGIASVEPEKNWFGNEEIRFVAKNEFGLKAESNSIQINISEEGDTPPRFVSLTAQGTINGTIDTDGYLFFECNVTDDYRVKEVSLYSDISGEWKLEETKEVGDRDVIAVFEIKGVANKDYHWGCSAKDNQGNETLSEKQSVIVSIEVSLEYTIPQFMVNNINTDRSFFVSFSGYLKDSLILGDLTIRKSNGQIYYQKDMSTVQHVEFDQFGSPQIGYVDDVKIVPSDIFDNHFAVGKRAKLEISLDYTYQGKSYKKTINHEIEVVSRTRSERSRDEH